MVGMVYICFINHLNITIMKDQLSEELEEFFTQQVETGQAMYVNGMYIYCSY